jgi:N-acetylneuraminic acid mutarotase
VNRHRRGWLVAIAALVAVAGCGGGGRKSATSTTTTPASTTTAPITTTTAPVSSTTVVPADAGTWSLIPEGPNAVGRPVAWTGNELLVAESACCGALGSVNLAAYNPVTNAWHKLPSAPLTFRTHAVGAWTGTEMIVAGGLANATDNAEHAVPVSDGAAWDGAANTWHAIAAMPTTLPILLPDPDSIAVWTGREMLVWSSVPAASTPATVGREVVLAYNPSTNTWRHLPASGLTPRWNAVTVWTGKELVVWGGFNSDFTTAYGDGASLDPTTGTWRRLPQAPVPARGEATAVWSGHEVLIWGGATGNGAEVGRGAAYNPVTNRWRALSPSPLRAKTRPAGVWTGHYFLVIGGSAGSALPTPAPGTAAYDPATNTWTALPAAPRYPPAAQNAPTFAADQRADGLVVWTGKSALLVGGLDFRQQGSRSDGLKWTPAE